MGKRKQAGGSLSRLPDAGDKRWTTAARDFLPMAEFFRGFGLNQTGDLSAK
jgi:hypothetical protein